MNYLQKVKCKAVLKRIHGTITKTVFSSTQPRTWRSIEMEFEGVIIGKRNLSIGIVYYETDHTKYSPQKYFTAYLVSVNMNQNPVYVLPEDINQ